MVSIGNHTATVAPDDVEFDDSFVDDLPDEWTFAFALKVMRGDNWEWEVKQGWWGRWET